MTQTAPSSLLDFTPSVNLAKVEPFHAETVQLMPRFEGSNINTWIGFKHVMYLLEEALLHAMRRNGLATRELFEEHGLCFEIVDSDARILTALHQDDIVTINVVPQADTPDASEAVFKITAYVDRDGKPVKAVSATMRALWRVDRSLTQDPALPGVLRGKVHPTIKRGQPEPDLAVDTAATICPAIARSIATDPIVALLAPPGGNAFVWQWHIPYFYCHFNDRIQHSGYLRLMEEVVDLFLHDRGISIRTMMDTRRWIPVVPHAQISILAEALMEEILYTVYTVEEVFKATTYTSRMDCYVVRDGKLIHTATGRITHGYALMHDRRKWTLAEFDAETLAALNRVA